MGGAVMIILLVLFDLISMRPRWALRTDTKREEEKKKQERIRQEILSVKDDLQI